MPQLTWLVTGCSSGFGEAFVHRILARGDRVIATGRQADIKLSHLKDTGASILDLDVTSPQAEIDAKIGEAMKIHDGGIDVLVNNAGYMQSGFVEEMTPEKLNRQFSTNLYGPIAVTRAILPHFRSKQRGIIVFMSSQSAWRGDPSISAYAASKFALEGMVESLGAEIAPFNIKPIIFTPGIFRTKAFSTSYQYHQSSLPEYAPIDAGTKAFVEGMNGQEPGDPVKAVERMIDVVRGEGMAAGKEMPFRLPLGTDGMGVVREKCLEMLRVCEEWEGLIRSTDFDDGGKKEGGE